jgi:hypothetical protein
MGIAIYTILASIATGAGITLVGTLVVAWVRQQRVQKTAAQRKTEERLTAEVLRNLSCLTSRVKELCTRSIFAVSVDFTS